MAAPKKKKVRWLSQVDAHDFPAARSYLGLIYDRKKVSNMIARLKEAPVVQFKAKDIFRASRLSLLGVSNSHVEKDRARMQKGEGLAPLLLVRDEANGLVVIADGYHRLCAVYEVDEDALICCRII
jgi:hypothetical protein